MRLPAHVVHWLGIGVVGFALAGCGAKPELGEVVETMPKVPGTEHRYQLPPRKKPTIPPNAEKSPAAAGIIPRQAPSEGSTNPDPLGPRPAP